MTKATTIEATMIEARYGQALKLAMAEEQNPPSRTNETYHSGQTKPSMMNVQNPPQWIVETYYN